MQFSDLRLAEPILRALSDDDFAKVYVHPELGPVRIDEGVALYSWHCRHHAGHIKKGLGIRD